MIGGEKHQLFVIRILKHSQKLYPMHNRKYIEQTQPLSIPAFIYLLMQSFAKAMSFETHGILYEIKPTQFPFLDGTKRVEKSKTDHNIEGSKDARETHYL